MRILLGAGVAAFFVAMIALVIRQCREEFIPLSEIQPKWDALPRHEKEAHRRRFDGDPHRHQLRRVI